MPTSDALAAAEAPLLGERNQFAHLRYHPRTVSRIVTRIIALTYELLPIQVEPDDLTSPVSAIINAQVIEAYHKIAGDFSPCLPYALLEARRYFRKQERLNPSDSDENNCRKLACEVLARKIVAKTPLVEQYALLSRRFTRIESDGDESLPLSALESAIDQHATFFLSSGESQRCVFALWRGLLVPKEVKDGGIQYVPYEGARTADGIMAEFDPDRLGVPRYQFFFRIFLWLLFVIAYSIADNTPDRGFGLEDVIIYVQLAGYLLEDLTKVWKIRSLKAIGFWTYVNFLIYILTGIAFVYRCLDLATTGKTSEKYRMLSFQFLSSASPLIWAKLLTVFDLYQYFGTLQIVVWRMLKESAVFFTLLGLLAIGFGQALTGLDVADNSRDSTETIIHSLIQGLLGSPAFDLYERGASSYPFGMILYYAWTIATLVILLNILVALFGSAYQECTDEAIPTFMAFFAGRTVEIIRAPDTYVYPAPFNLIELFLLPFEKFVDKRTYAKMNRYVMGFVFFAPLIVIAVYENHFDRRRTEDFLGLLEESEPFSAEDEDPKPQVESDDYGTGDGPDESISKVAFEELRKSLPDLSTSTQGTILKLVKELQSEVESLRKELKEKKA